mgnify:CR=1 FL=1
MLYYLFDYLDKVWDFPGAGVFQYISFRASMAVITSLLISLVFGKSLINYLKKKQVGETVRDLGLEGQKEKQGTPTMGGLIILGSILIPTLLFAKLNNIYIILMLVTTVWLGLIGFLDDYIKVFKKDKKGLAGKFKILGQVTLGIIVGTTMYFHDGIVIKEKVKDSQYVKSHNILNETNYEVAKEVFNKTGSGKMAVKAQIHAGGRGKGGGVKIANSIDEVYHLSQQIIGMQLVTHQTGPEGKKVHKVLIEQNIYYGDKSEIKEIYMSILLNRNTGRYMILYSPRGGMDIETVAEETPELIFTEEIDPKVGLLDFQTR